VIGIPFYVWDVAERFHRDVVEDFVAVLGEHDGAYAFTVGQGRGLRIGDPAGDGRPKYVVDIEPVTRTVTVGSTKGRAHSRKRTLITCVK
jgi:tRNA U34 2-thiouridine synthase MnmA/TrmU